MYWREFSLFLYLSSRRKITRNRDLFELIYDINFSFVIVKNIGSLINKPLFWLPILFFQSPFIQKKIIYLPNNPYFFNNRRYDLHTTGSYLVRTMFVPCWFNATMNIQPAGRGTEHGTKKTITRYEDGRVKQECLDVD